MNQLVMHLFATYEIPYTCVVQPFEILVPRALRPFVLSCPLPHTSVSLRGISGSWPCVSPSPLQLCYLLSAFSPVHPYLSHPVIPFRV